MFFLNQSKNQRFNSTFFLPFFLLSSAILGCAMNPKTISEFKKICSDRKGKKVVQVPSSVATVKDRIDRYAKKCHHFSQKQKFNYDGHGRANGQFTDHFKSRWENMNQKRISFVLTYDSRQYLNRQPGGFFAHVIELEPKHGGTEATLYDYNHFMTHKYIQEFTPVVQGKTTTCLRDKKSWF